MTAPLKIFTRPGRIGLMADSHSNLAGMQSCIRCLQKDHGAGALVHLGDIFDSVKPHQLCELIDTITRHHIAAVKGNNDFHLQNMLSGGSALGLSMHEKSYLSCFLADLPLKIMDMDTCFTHSLPFDSIRSLYEPVDDGTTVRAGHIFNQTHYHLVCCGHSHSPSLFRWRAGRITRESIAPGEPVFLKADERYIIVVGAIDHGECGVLDYGRQTYERIRLRPEAPEKDAAHAGQGSCGRKQASGAGAALEK